MSILMVYADISVYGKDRGALRRFFEVHVSEDMHANKLSFSDVDDMYQITCIPRESFTSTRP
jgi:hypothetical protein